MDTKKILELTKTQLKEGINKLPSHAIPRWINSAKKDELAGYLMTANEIPQFQKTIRDFLINTEVEK